MSCPVLSLCTCLHAATVLFSVLVLAAHVKTCCFTTHVGLIHIDFVLAAAITQYALLQDGQFADCPVLEGFLHLLKTDKSKVQTM